MTVLDEHPHAAVSVLVVWVPVLESDSLVAAEAVTHLVHDPRAEHFYDGDRRIGKAIAASVGGKGNLAWDCYLFYLAGAHWGQAPPAPVLWVHQLGPGTWADPGRFHWADALIERLRSVAADLLG